MEVLVTFTPGNIERPSRYIHVFATFSLRDRLSNVPMVVHLRNMFVLHTLSQLVFFTVGFEKGATPVAQWFHVRGYHFEPESLRCMPWCHSFLEIAMACYVPVLCFCFLLR